MSNISNIIKTENQENESKDNQQIPGKKYRTHGRITAGDDSSIEVSYYECDEVKCDKIVYKKNKESK